MKCGDRTRGNLLAWMRLPSVTSALTNNETAKRSHSEIQVTNAFTVFNVIRCAGIVLSHAHVLIILHAIKIEFRAQFPRDTAASAAKHFKAQSDDPIIIIIIIVNIIFPPRKTQTPFIFIVAAKMN